MAHPEIEEWLNTFQGVAMNPDGHYGLQCVDLVDQYAQDIFGVPWSQCVGGVNGARELLDVTPDKYWIRTDNNPADPNLIPARGDVFVFAGSAINQWGHTGVCLEAYPNGMWVGQQDGFAAPLVWADGNWYSNKPAHKAWLSYDSNGTGPIAGWLSPRENMLVGYTPPAPAPVPVPAPLPAPIGTNLRVTVADGVNRRKAADAKGELIDTFGGDLELTMGGFIRSSSAYGTPYNDGNNVWFVGGISGGYMHSSGFTDQSTAGLPDLTGTEPSMPVAAVPVPEVKPYSFVPDFDFVEYIPANITNVEIGKFPLKPEKLAVHQMGTPGVDTIGSTINEFKNASTFKSAHFAVSKGRIVQMVSLKDRAYHAREAGNVFIGIETDPLQDDKTIASVRKLIKAIYDRYGYVLTLIRHNEIPGNVTTCGTLIDLEDYKIEWPTKVEPVPPAPEPHPEIPVPVPMNEATVLMKFFQWLINLYTSSKK